MTTVHDHEELPESVQIAELLAELMPEPGAPAKAKLQHRPSSVSALAVETPSSSASEAHEARSLPTVEPPRSVIPQTGPATFAVVDKPVGSPKQGSTVDMRSPVRGKPKPEVSMDSALPPPLPISSKGPASAERIPLGDLSVEGFFGLVNWRNDPAQVRHPPFAPRYDPETAAELGKIPFMLLDEPPVEQESTVAAVLKSFAW